jgi:hypothetical protein
MSSPLSALLGCALVLACGGGSPDSKPPVNFKAGSVQVGQPRAVVSPASSTTSSPCPRTGRWALCSVERRLVQAGFVVNRVSGEGERRAGFSVSPAVYALGRSRLDVFVYPDEAAVERDVAKLDTLAAAPRGTRGQWPTMPTWVRSANLLAVFLTDNPTQAERLTLALTAGAPQP